MNVFLKRLGQNVAATCERINDPRTFKLDSTCWGCLFFLNMFLTQLGTPPQRIEFLSYGALKGINKKGFVQTFTFLNFQQHQKYLHPAGTPALKWKIQFWLFSPSLSAAGIKMPPSIPNFFGKHQKKLGRKKVPNLRYTALCGAVHNDRNTFWNTETAMKFRYQNRYKVDSYPDLVRVGNGPPGTNPCSLRFYFQNLSIYNLN